VTASGQGSGNATQAKSILTAAGYTGVGTALKNKAGKAVKIRCSYTVGNTIRQQTCQLVQSQLAALGITVTPTPITDLGGTLASGDFDLIDFAWVGTPFVVTDAQGIFELAGGGDYGFNKDPAEEALLNQAGNNTDPATIQRLVNEADVALTNDAYNLPLYQKPTYLAAYANLANIRDNSSSVGPPYNVQDWGIRTAS
jgi:peptide/nickel transport system substrate-binding protein